MDFDFLTIIHLSLAGLFICGIGFFTGWMSQQHRVASLRTAKYEAERLAQIAINDVKHANEKMQQMADRFVTMNHETTIAIRQILQWIRTLDPLSKQPTTDKPAVTCNEEFKQKLFFVEGGIQ